MSMLIYKTIICIDINVKCEPARYNIIGVYLPCCLGMTMDNRMWRDRD